MLEVGIKGQRETVVTKDKTATGIGSGLLEGFATPVMIALMEESSFMSVNERLDEGFTTVGIAVDIKHISATPVGMKVVAKSELLKIDGRELTFKVEAYDEKGLIGEGIHKRFIVNNEKIKSSAIAAEAAINELVGYDTSKKQNQQVEFSYTSEIAGMEAGRQACNQMLQAVSDFSSAVLTQANKFPEIAHKIEKRDVELAKRWEH